MAENTLVIPTAVGDASQRVPLEQVPLAPAIAPAAPLDADDQALAQALREAAIEDGNSPGQPAAQPAPGAPARPAGAAQAPADAGHMVPKARMDEVIAQARSNASAAEEWRNRSLYFEGVAAASRTAPPAAGAPAPQQQAAPAQAQPQRATIEQKIGAQQALMIEAAKKFDTGEITAEALTGINIAANNHVAALRERALYDAVLARMPEPQTSLSDERTLDQAAFNLEQRHPWCFEFRDAEWAWLETVADDFFLKSTGQPMRVGNSQDALRKRAFMAQMTEVLGPWLFPDKIANVEARRAAVQQRQGQLQQQRQPAGGQRPALSAPAGGAPATALDRFNAHPPNLNGAGTQGITGEISEDRLANMTTDEIEALPDAVRARYM
jgi:hypothetical protein